MEREFETQEQSFRISFFKPMYSLFAGAFLISAGLAWLMCLQQGKEFALRESIRQEVLTGRIALLALKSAQTLDKVERSEVQSELLAACERLTLVHQSFLMGNDAENVPSVAEAGLDAIYFEAPIQLDERLRKYIDAAQVVASLATVKEIKRSKSLEFLSRDSAGYLINSLRRASLGYEQFYSQRGEWLRYAVFSLFGIFSLLLFFVYRYQLRSIRGRTHYHLYRSADILRDTMGMRDQINSENLAFSKKCENLQAALDSAREGLLIIDHQTRRLEFNRSFVELWEIPDNILAVDSYDGLHEHLNLRIEDAAAFNLKFVSREKLPKKGLNIAVSLVDGTIVQLITEDRDFPTGKKRVCIYRVFEPSAGIDRVLKEKITVLQSIVTSVSEGVLVTNAKGRIMQMNTMAEHLLQQEIISGLPGKWIKQFGFTKYGTSEPVEEEEFPLSRALSGVSVTRSDLSLHQSKTEAIIDLRLVSKPLLDATGNVFGAILLMRPLSGEADDLSVLIHNEEELSNEMRITNGVLTGALDHDFNGKIRRCDKNGCVLLGYSPGELERLTVKNIFAKQAVEQVGREYKELSSNYPVRFRAKMLTRQFREFYADLTASIVGEGDNRFVRVQFYRAVLPIEAPAAADSSDVSEESEKPSDSDPLPAEFISGNSAEEKGPGELTFSDL
ncbi:MAG: PAS domain-containing protein [Calditrichia bacterium]